MLTGRRLQLNRFETRQRAMGYLVEQGYCQEGETGVFQSQDGARAVLREFRPGGQVQVLVIPPRPGR